MFRQGDLLIVPIDKVQTKRLMKVRDNIILRGEATGHAHKLVGGELFKDYGWHSPEMYIHVPNHGQIVHEEHDPIGKERDEEANKLENIITLCDSCHKN